MQLFNKAILVTTKKFAEIESKMMVNPDAQRKLSKIRVKSIARYYLRALKGEINAYIAPIVVANAPKGKLLILDGQHRWEGFKTLIKELSSDENFKELLEKAMEIDIPLMGYKDLSL